MDVAIARASWTSQTMVMQIPVTQDTNAREWSHNPYVFITRKPGRGSVQPPASESELDGDSVQPSVTENESGEDSADRMVRS